MLPTAPSGQMGARLEPESRGGGGTPSRLQTPGAPGAQLGRQARLPPRAAPPPTSEALPRPPRRRVAEAAPSFRQRIGPAPEWLVLPRTGLVDPVRRQHLAEAQAVGPRPRPVAWVPE